MRTTPQVTSLPAPPDLNEHQRRQLASLSLEPGWPILRGVVKQEMERRFGALSRALMQGKDVYEMSPSIEWQRGFFAGMKFLLDNPEIESKKLDREFEQRKVSEVDA